MNSREQKDRGLAYPQKNLESPFLDQELFVAETDIESEAHLTTLQRESPFERALEQTPAIHKELEEQFSEEELPDQNDFVADEAETQDDEPLSELEERNEEAYHEERPDDEGEGGVPEVYAALEEPVVSEEDWMEAEEEESAYPLEEATRAEKEYLDALEEAFLDELDEEDEYVIFETETVLPPALKVSKRALKVPESNPVPFAPAPPLGSYWPIVTNIRKGREVNYLAADKQQVGTRPDRRFLASRSAGARHHVGIDLFANFNDPVCACQDGKIINFYGFCCGTKKTTHALLVEHAGVVVNYGEVAPNSLDRTGRQIGSQVLAGDIIGFIGRNPGGSSMLHFEAYSLGTRRNATWKADESRPAELLNPTEYLLFLSEFGLVGRATSVSPSQTTVPKAVQGAVKPSAELVRFAQRVLNTAEGERLDDDGDLGPLTRGALKRFRTKYKLGAGGVLDAKTELALVQRALEEIAQQSLFPQPGLRDAKTDQSLAAFKSARGLGSDVTLNAATRAALTDALVRRTASFDAPTLPSSLPPRPDSSTGVPTDGARVSDKVIAATEQYRSLAEAAASKYGVDSTLIRGVIAAESGGNKDLVAKSGYAGLMQAGKGEIHKRPATSIDTGTKKLRDFRVIMEGVLKGRGQRYDRLSGTEQLRLLALAYNAGPVTVAKALQYAAEAGSPERWLDAEHYKRALLFTGAYSLKQAASSCLKSLSPSERESRMREAVQFWNQWRLGTKKTNWRKLDDPPPWPIVSASLPAFVVCAIDFKHRNSPKYAAKILAYQSRFQQGLR